MHPIKPYVERVTAQPKRKVDDTTGQIYYENSVKARSMLPSWMWKTRGRVDDPRVRKNKRLGAASLMDMALRSMARNMTRIDYEALRCIPSHIAMKLANLITSSETWSLETWETFVAAHPEAVPDMNYKLDIPDARGTNLCELPSLNKHLSNLTFDHVTRLSIVELAFTTDNLFEIAKIPNLEVLNLQGRVSGNSVDDSVYNDYFLSRWSYVVLGSGHLSKLRVLIFRHFDVTSATLKKLSPFPALALCNLESVCLKSDRNNTSRNGWEVIG
ncbi:hypothetical protein BU16DRAFT_522978 [Lophium mytilinum]|uniref:Uncharacterized protein n=1 Tax=Lophium mytilinum TaxID=390894 RepID=A0A6A6R708_9PEZI|nr:hypothetical protein BU16DRAFT_522978 [Lophium mytilinum]